MIIITSLSATAIVLAITIPLYFRYAVKKEFVAKKDHEAHKRTHYQNQLPKGDDLDAPEPGKVMISDFRGNNGKNEIKLNKNKQLRVITWNIERGYRINQVIAELLKINADIILLQEVDIGCQRTNMLSIGNEIANALKLQCVYASDCWHVNGYHENDGKKDTSKMKFNSKPHNGSEGNAILTKFDIKHAYPVIMQCVRNKYKPKHDHLKRHTAVVCVMDTGSELCGELVCYSAHFDAYSGRVDRSTIQYKSIYEDILIHHTTASDTSSSDLSDFKNDGNDGNNENKNMESKRRTVIVAGDLNTHNHGVVRFVKGVIGDDSLKYSFWGMSEAEWWDRFVIGKELHIVSNKLSRIGRNRVRLSDPFNKETDVTAKKLWHGICVWSGKIDWMLYDVDKLIVTKKYVSNTNETISDHEYLLCDFKPREQTQ